MSKRLQDATADNIVRQFLVLRTSSTKFCELSDSVLKLEKFRQARDNSASIVECCFYRGLRLRLGNSGSVHVVTAHIVCRRDDWRQARSTNAILAQQRVGWSTCRQNDYTRVSRRMPVVKYRSSWSFRKMPRLTSPSM